MRLQLHRPVAWAAGDGAEGVENEVDAPDSRALVEDGLPMTEQR